MDNHRIIGKMQNKMKTYFAAFFNLIHDVDTIKQWNKAQPKIDILTARWTRECKRNECTKFLIPAFRVEVDIAKTIVILDEVYAAKSYMVLIRQLDHLEPEERAIQLIADDNFELC